MRRTAWLWLAALSICGAASRPRYGGTLRIETRAAAADLADPAAPPALRRLAGLVFEPLTTLSTSWTSDPAGRRWEFHLRPGIKMHDGSALNAATAAAALQPAARAVGPDTVVIESERGSPEPPLLRTGPFRVLHWDPGRRATLAAFDDYWGGRPFLDTIEVEMNRPLRDQYLDLELGRADLVELGPAEVRRAAERGRRTWSSAPLELLAVVFNGGKAAEPRLREALALAIDRAAIQSVLLQRQGEISGAILPQWISGYAFVFPASPDLARARRLAAELPPASRVLTLGYDAGDPLARMVAERIAVNAHDAGLAVQALPGARADARLVPVHLDSADPGRGLASAAGQLGLPAPPPAATLEAFYQAERAMLEGYRVVPLVHVPWLFGTAGRVRTWAPAPVTRLGEWRLADVWLSGDRP